MEEGQESQKKIKELKREIIRILGTYGQRISARVSDLPEEPPTELVEDAYWVQVVAY